MKRFCRRMTLLLTLLASITVRGDSVVVVCPEGWRQAMSTWAAFRTSQGHRIEFATPARRSTKAPPDLLLLVGDGGAVGPPPGATPSQINRRYGPESTIATDTVYAVESGARVVARLPFSTPEQLSGYLERVVRRETSAPPTGRHRLRVAAGVGGFSPMIDAAIEASARRLVSDLAPESSEVSLRRCPNTTASAPGPEHQRGGVWVWLGHGLRNRLPGIESSRLVAEAGGAEVAVLLACYAGDFAAPGECVAERLLLDPSGPLAVIASTRVSMPYGNARLGGELLAAMQRRPYAAIGSLFAEARDRSLAETADERLAGLDAIAMLLGAAREELPTERREHAAMYCLLGDPLVAIDPAQSPSRLAEAPSASY